MTQLKDCPFCGSRVKMTKGLMKGTNVIVCPKCGADVMFYGADHDTTKFIKKWNSRAIPGRKYEA